MSDRDEVTLEERMQVYSSVHVTHHVPNCGLISQPHLIPTFGESCGSNPQTSNFDGEISQAETSFNPLSQPSVTLCCGAQHKTMAKEKPARTGLAVGLNRGYKVRFVAVESRRLTSWRISACACTTNRRPRNAVT